ncbi:protein-L-isoaspartate(D-aspartate) O-methyltransferase [Paraburkholderia sp. BCC1885]|uniref:protein-L-isoaspartate(D-aspartate) O-methyltransferase n=1 Tax=Paraburkholderia sp. BCC1885 TaxID=2562669 RepID=UPI001183B4B2|nr:protein-L-isoaspartate(D-aspartate) O-methyltransferase [Paraburkholderia sp. BCC1885]
MTNERAKRFPLGLEDLVREPRRPEGRPGEVRAATLAKAPAAAVVKPAVTKSALKPALKPASKPVLVKPAAKPAAPVVTKQSATLANPLANRAAPRPTAPRPSVKPAERSAAPNVALNGALALTSERVRERMVERLRANGISDQRVIHAMSVVPRHMFVDPGLAPQAYEDAALPIGHHQTISKPSVVARMIELAAAGRTLANVLEIGTGCGYQAAVLSQVARDVYSIERIKPLYERAKTNLRPLRIPNVRLHYGDGRIGLPAAAPFDAIVIAAAGLDVPQALLEQLAIGGRLVAPVGTQDGQTQQVLTLVERTGPAQWRESRLDRVFFVPLKSGVI